MVLDHADARFAVRRDETIRVGDGDRATRAGFGELDPRFRVKIPSIGFERAGVGTIKKEFERLRALERDRYGGLETENKSIIWDVAQNVWRDRWDGRFPRKESRRQEQRIAIGLEYRTTGFSAGMTGAGIVALLWGMALLALKIIRRNAS